MTFDPTGHFLFQFFSFFLRKCGNEDDYFPVPFLFHSSSLDGLSTSLTAVVELRSASIDFFSIFMHFLAPRHCNEGWNQQKLMEFWLLQLSSYLGRHGRKNEKENRSKNRCLYSAGFMKKIAIEWQKNVQKEPGNCQKALPSLPYENCNQWIKLKKLLKAIQLKVANKPRPDSILDLNQWTMA